MLFIGFSYISYKISHSTLYLLHIVKPICLLNSLTNPLTSIFCEYCCQVFEASNNIQGFGFLFILVFFLLSLEPLSSLLLCSSLHLYFIIFLSQFYAYDLSFPSITVSSSKFWAFVPDFKFSVLHMNFIHDCNEE